MAAARGFTMVEGVSQPKASQGHQGSLLPKKDWALLVGKAPALNV